MTLTADDVVAAYEMILGRAPESRAVAEMHAAAHADRASLGAALLRSAEARARLATHAAHHVVTWRLGLQEADLALLEHLAPWTHRDAEEGFVVDSLGTRTRVAFFGDAAWSRRVLPEPYPADFHAETVEWIALVKAVRAARGGRFRMAELGAGWGAWTSAAHALARRFRLDDVRLHAVEADAGIFARLRQHVADNGIGGAVLHHAAIGLEPGSVRWPVRGPGLADYGARPVAGEGADYRGQPVAMTEAIPVLPLRGLLALEERWDLVHMDVQGLEAELCRGALPLLAASVAHVIVATHSKALDAACFDLFHEAGWRCLNNCAPHVAHDPAWPSLEAMTVLDGTQLWRNPAVTPGGTACPPS